MQGVHGSAGQTTSTASHSFWPRPLRHKTCARGETLTNPRSHLSSPIYSLAAAAASLAAAPALRRRSAGRACGRPCADGGAPHRARATREEHPHRLCLHRRPCAGGRQEGAQALPRALHQEDLGRPRPPLVAGVAVPRTSRVRVSRRPDR